jgi:prophage DNA circulation protein
MTFKEEIQPASYKDANFLLNVASFTGGKKFAQHEYPNSNVQNIENLGLRPRDFQLTAIISEPDYIEKRNVLIRALESTGSGVLIHPFYGRMENMEATSFTGVEDLSRLGDLEIKIDFKSSNSTGLPISNINTLSAIQTQKDVVFTKLKLFHKDPKYYALF